MKAPNRQQSPKTMITNAQCSAGPRAKSIQSIAAFVRYRSALAPPPEPEAPPSAEHCSRKQTQQRGIAPGASAIPILIRGGGLELESGPHPHHHDVAVKTGHPPQRLNFAA